MRRFWERKTKKRKGVPRRVALVKAVIIMATPRSKSLHGKGRKCIARNIYQVLESPLGDGAEFPSAMLTNSVHGLPSVQVLGFPLE